MKEMIEHVKQRSSLTFDGAACKISENVMIAAAGHLIMIRNIKCVKEQRGKSYESNNRG